MRKFYVLIKMYVVNYFKTAYSSAKKLGWAINKFRLLNHWQLFALAYLYGAQKLI